MALSKEAQKRNRELQKAKLSNAVRALEYAAPWCFAAYFQNHKACVAASVAGAAALRTFGVEAEAQYCVAVADCPPELGIPMAIGFSHRELYDWNLKIEPHMPPFDEWQKTMNSPDDQYPFHMIIRARHGGYRGFIDLTLVQLRQHCSVPFAIASLYADSDREWPRYEYGNGLTIQYMASPHADHLAPPEYNHEDLAGVLVRIMGIALEWKLDRKRFDLDMLDQSRNVVLPNLSPAEFIARVKSWGATF